MRIINRILASLFALAMLVAAPAAIASQNTCVLPTSGTLSGLTLVTTLNNCHDTLITQFSGASAPGTPSAYQFWADTTTGTLKVRNAANTAWLIIGAYNASVGFTPYSGGVTTNAITSTGSANAYVLTYSPAATAYVTGQTYAFISNFANTGSATVNINGLGAKTLKKKNSTNLAANDILSGQVVEVLYDGTNLQLISPVSTVLDGSGGSLSGALDQAQGSDIASATTTNLCTATGNYVHVTGTTTITGFGTCQAGTQRIVRFTGALTLTHNATSLILPTGANIATAADDRIEAVSLGSGNWIVVDYMRASGFAINNTILRGYIDGCILANNGTDAANDIDVGACQATDDGVVFTMNGAALTKQIDAAWAVGNNAGCRDTGTEASSTWYHVYMIRRTDTGVVDYLCSTSATSPTMPGSYTQKRRIGAIFNDSGSSLKAFNQYRDQFLWLSPVLDVNVTNLGTSRTLYTLTTPLGVKTMAILNIGLGDAGTHQVYLTSPDVTDEAPSLTAAPLASLRATAGYVAGVGPMEWRTNTSSQIGARSSNINTDFAIATLGWIDPRGQDQ